MTTALCPGSFDPPTNGHIDVIERTARYFERLVVAVIANPSKEPMFTVAEQEFRLGVSRYFTGIVRDITERKSAEQELRQAEERMRSVVNHVVDGIISIDERGIVTTYNPAAERIFGYVADEVIGQNVKMLMPQPYRDEHDGYLARYREATSSAIQR